MHASREVDSLRDAVHSRAVQIGTLLLALAGVFAALAALCVSYGEPGWMVGGALLAWLAFSFAWTAAGYLGLGAWVLGKRRDNTRHPLAYLVAGPFLIVMQSVRRLRTAVSSEPVYNLVADRMYVGRITEAEALPRDAAMVVDMTAEFLEPKSAQAFGAYRCLPTLDGIQPALEDLSALAHEVARFEGPVYVHCAAGHGRSSLLACCALLARGDYATVDETVRAMQSKRPKIHLARSQRAIAERFARELLATSRDENVPLSETSPST